MALYERSRGCRRVAFRTPVPGNPRPHVPRAPRGRSSHSTRAVACAVGRLMGGTTSGPVDSRHVRESARGRGTAVYDRHDARVLRYVSREGLDAGEGRACTIARSTKTGLRRADPQPSIRQHARGARAGDTGKLEATCSPNKSSASWKIPRLAVSWGSTPTCPPPSRRRSRTFGGAISHRRRR